MNKCPPSLCVQMFSAYSRKSSRANDILELARTLHPSYQCLAHVCSCLANRQDLLKLLPTPSHVQPSYLCSWLPVTPSDSGVKSYCFRSAAVSLSLLPALVLACLLTICPGINQHHNSSYFHCGPHCSAEKKDLCILAGRVEMLGKDS